MSVKNYEFDQFDVLRKSTSKFKIEKMANEIRTECKKI